MDNDQQMRVIEARLDELAGMPINDDQSARQALTHAMATVSGISQLSATMSAEPAPGTRPLATAEAPLDPLLDRLRTWIDRLVDALTRIVAKMTGATSFSIMVGTGLSVSVNFGPFHG